MLPAAQQRPTKKRMTRSGSVDLEIDGVALENRIKMPIDKIWIETAAAYPTPTPLEEMWFDSCN